MNPQPPSSAENPTPTNTPPSPESQPEVLPSPERQQNVPPSPERQQSVPLSPERQQDVPSSLKRQQDVPPFPERQQDVPSSPERQQEVLQSPGRHQDVPPSPRRQQDELSSPERQQGVSPSPQSQQDVPPSPEKQQDVPSSPKGQQDVSLSSERQQDVPSSPERQQYVPSSPEKQQDVCPSPERQLGMPSFPERQQDVSPFSTRYVRYSLSPEIVPVINKKILRTPTTTEEDQPEPKASRKRPREGDHDSENRPPTATATDNNNFPRQSSPQLAEPVTPNPKFKVPRQQGLRSFSLLDPKSFERNPSSICATLKFRHKTPGQRTISPSPLIPTASSSHPTLEASLQTEPLQTAVPVISVTNYGAPSSQDILPSQNEQSFENQATLLSPPPPPPQTPTQPTSVFEPGPMGRLRLPARKHRQTQPPTASPLRSEGVTIPTKNIPLADFLHRYRGTYHTKSRVVDIHVRDPVVAATLYQILAETPGVEGLAVKLDWAWTELDLEQLGDIVEHCKFAYLKVDGCSKEMENTALWDNKRPSLLSYKSERKTPDIRLYNRPNTVKAVIETEGLGTRFDPLIRLLQVKTLKRLHLTNMSECLKEFSELFPEDLSHLDVLQIHVDVDLWDGIHARRFSDLIERLTHLKRLIIECSPTNYRGHLENTRRALMCTPHAAAAGSSSAARPPLPDIEVQLHTRGVTHVVVHFKRPSLRATSLVVDVCMDRRHEVEFFWLYLLNCPASQTTRKFELINSPIDTWVDPVNHWLTTRQRHQRHFSASTSTSATNSKGTTTFDPAFFLLHEVTLCCKRMKSNTEDSLLELLATATSPALGLKKLQLVGLHLPLPPPPPCDVSCSPEKRLSKKEGKPYNPPNQKFGRSKWLHIFMNPALALWNLEEFAIIESNFGDSDVDGFLAFIHNVEMRRQEADKKRRERETAKEEEAKANKKRKREEEEVKRREEKAKRKKEEKAKRKKAKVEKMEELEEGELEEGEIEEGEVEEDTEEIERAKKRSKKESGEDKEGEAKKEKDDVEKVEDHGQVFLRTVTMNKHNLTFAGRQRLVQGIYDIQSSVKLIVDLPEPPKPSNPPNPHNPPNTK
ncbi:hypothetical protein BGX23_004734 [Mortierella sp. AD031]|nr:hypothetical protein BGX23_004734 [Mortierella sp. AD031]